MTPALDPRRSVTLKASAGTGKTWQLTARILRLLLAGTKPEGILALTFTRKAAAEMRGRIGARLRELAFCDDAALARRLAEIGLDLDAAPRARGLYEDWLHAPLPLRATTIHAFCQELVARFPLEAGVAPGCQVEEAEGGLLATAVEALLHRLTADPSAPAAQALQTLAELGETEWKLRELLRGFLERRADWWAYAGHAADPLDFALGELRRQLGVADDTDPATRLDADAFGFKLGTFYRWLERAGGFGHIKPQRVEPALSAHGAARYEALLAGLFKKDGAPYELRLSKAVQQRFSAAERGHIEQTHGELIAELAAVRDGRLRWLTLRRTRAGLTLGAAALDTLAAQLRRRNTLTFSELEWLACRLLQAEDGRLWVRYKLDQRIEHLLVDEFQDTSPTQWSLLRPLLEDMAAREPERPRSAFLVGDAKQSIYGFRRANPELLAAAEQWLAAHLDGASGSLSESHRSAPAIVEYVNTLFALPEAAALLPDFPAHATVRREWGRVELAPLEQAGAEETQAPAFRNPLEQPRLSVEDRRAAQEGERIARRIRALVDARVAVAVHGRTRALAYGDVLILVRARSRVGAIERALAAARIPFVGSARGALLEAAEVGDLLALLRALHAPHRDLDLAQALRSPLFGAGDEELAQLALAARDGDGWRAALERLAADPARPALGRAQALLSNWDELAARLPVHDLLERILHEGNVAARYEAALPTVLQARVRGNLGALAQLALDLDGGRYPGLGKFLDRLERLRAVGDDAPDEPAAAGADGAVRVLTIHAAKGLEAPAVFLAQAASVPQGRSRRWLVEWPPDAARPTHFVLDGGKDARDALCAGLLQAQERRARREELNLLYVALTRARQLLHISGFANRNAADSAYALCAQACAALPPSAAAPLPGCEAELAWGAGEFAAAPAEAPSAAAPSDPRLRRPLAAVAAGSVRPSGPAAVDPAVARRGDAVHALLQALADDPQAPEARLRAAVDRCLTPAARAAEFAEWLEEARAVRAAPALAAFFDPQRYRRAYNEVPLGYVEDGREVRGVMDRLVDDGTTLWVLDYKTQRDPDPAQLAALYAPQLALYARGVARLWPGRAVRAGLLLTATCQWVELAPI